MGTLGGLYRSDFAAFPKHDGFLKADADRVRAIEGEYRKSARGRPLVGVSWRSFKRQSGWQKSIPPDQWAPLLARDDILAVDLQYGDTAEERRGAETQGISLFHDDEIDSMKDFDAAAAQIAAMDIVVSTSNSAAHLAGALGKPTILLLPKRFWQHWYWFPERTPNPWYPTVTVVQQEKPGSWSDVIDHTRVLFDRFLSQKG